MSQNDSDIPEINPPEAMEILKSDRRSALLDVRSKVEFDYVGHPAGAIHVPWQEAPTWEILPDFVDRVRARLNQLYPDIPAEDVTVLALCRSGGRSRDAGIELARNGFKKVINIREGFEGKLDENRHRGNTGGWRFHKLPWEQT
jgi:rhodanese-related sulfurtransferase